MNKTDKKIDEILDIFCKSEGEIIFDLNFKMYYKENVNIFHRMISENKLITPNIQGKMSLTQFGEEVCESGGWIKYLKKQDEKDYLSPPSRYQRYILTPIKAMAKHIRKASWEVIIGVLIFIIGYAIGKYLLKWY